MENITPSNHSIRIIRRGAVTDSDDDYIVEENEEYEDDDDDDDDNEDYETVLPSASSIPPVSVSDSFMLNLKEEHNISMLRIIMKNRIEQNYYMLSTQQKNWISIFFHSSKEIPNNIIHEIYNINQTCFKLYQIPQIVYILTNIYILKSKQNGMRNSTNILLFIKITAFMIVDVFHPIVSVAEKNTINNLIYTSINLLSIELPHAAIEDEEYQKDTCCGGIFNFGKNRVRNEI